MSEITRRALLGRGIESVHAPITASSIRTCTCGSTTRRFRSREGAHVPDRDAAPETLLGLMKANGVAKTVIIQVIHYRYDNRYLASVLKRYPGTFQGVCRVDPLDPGGARSSLATHRRGLSRRPAQSGGECRRRLVSRSAHAAAVETMP